MRQADTLFVRENAPFPNSPLPVLIYPDVFSGQEPAFAKLFLKNGWTGVWVNGVYSFHHFHAAAHEALGCQSGWARLMLGGPNGEEVTITRGTAVLLPSGTGHQLLSCSADFSIAGAYPKGQSPDLQRGDANRYEQLKTASRSVPLPESDPVYGLSGPVTALWRLPG